MRRGYKSTISILEFIRIGKFGGLELGCNYHYILDFFHKPDHISRMSKGIYIWRYGVFEFHFFDGELIMFWCDHLDFMYSPRKKQFKLDRWIIGKYKNGFNLKSFTEELKKEKINFTKLGTYFSSDTKDSLPDNVILNIDDSNTVIYFEDLDEHATSYWEYKLIAIGASNSKNEYRTRPL